jgi:hypothetical protein
MENGINGYQGLNLDIGYDSIQNTFYIDALNIRISTVKGESQGSVTNIKGNKFYFDIPVTGSWGDPPANWTALNPEIIGSTSIRNKIIIFVADDSDSKGWIYELDYNETDCAFNSLTLKYYAVDFNFKKSWPIEAVGRYESDCYRRVYWSDYNNFFRGINLEAPNLDNLPVGLIDIFPDLIFTLPLLTNVLGGGSLSTGTWQYTFRLITEDGKVTLMAPGSNLIHTVSDTEAETQSARYNGDRSGINSGKSHEVTIDTSDYGFFKSIELIAIYYQDLNGTPAIYSIEEKDILEQSEVVFIHTGTEEEVVIENFEYTLTRLAFNTVKTLTPKDNSLIVANIKGKSFDINSLLDGGETFDSRTKRFRADGSLPNPDTTDENKLLNAFNQNYNKDAHWDVDWHNDEQYKFKADLTTLGGDSPNISYKFHLEPFWIDGDVQPGFANLGNLPQPTPNLNDGYSYVNTTYPSEISPFMTGILRGYKRGETYRFGIIFYNNKGEASFVNYIGDIKFPDISEEDGVVNTSNSVFFPLSRETSRLPSIASPGTIITEAYALGVEFTIDFSSCPSIIDDNKITGYQIVRLKRDTPNKRRLCSGIIKVGYEPLNIGPENPAFPNLKGPNGEASVIHLWNNEPDYGFNGTLYNIQTRDQNGAHTKWEPLEMPITGEYLTFHSPEISFEYDSKIAEQTILQNGTAGLLITGLYAQYPSERYDDAYTPYEATGQFFNASNQVTPDEYSFTIKEFYSSELDEDLGRFWDLRRKPRTVIPVLKDSALRNIEYIKRWDNKVKSTFTNVNQEDDALLTAELEGATHNLAGKKPFRNYHIFANFDPSLVTYDLNAPLTMVGPDNISVLSKGATGILGNIEKYLIDPLENTSIPIPEQSTADFFNSNGYSAFPTANPISARIPYVGFSYPYYDTGGATWQTFTPTTPADIDQLGFTSIPIVDTIIPKEEIYGGFSQDALEGNIFIPASPFIDIDNVAAYEHTFKTFGGDIFLNMWTFQDIVTNLDRRFMSGGYGNNLSTTTTLVVESELNIGLSFGSTIKTGVGRDVFGSTGNNERWRQETGNSETDYGKLTEDLRRNMYVDSYNEAYSREKSDLFFLIKPSDISLDCNKNDIRAYISNVKINEETLDSWTQFGANNNYDVDDYGAINKIVNFRDEVYFFQDKAVGAYSINPRAIVSTEDGIPTELGSGEGFQDHQYITNEHGSIHQWAVKKTDTGIYYYDAIHNKIFRISQGNEPLSELTGIHSFLNNFVGDIYLRKEDGGDNPILNKGAHITRDKINDEVLFTFLGTWQALPLEGNTTYFPGDIIQTSGGTYYEFVEEYTTTGIKEEDDLIVEILPYTQIPVTLPASQWTIVFDELAQKFSSFYSGKPPIYLENGNILLSPDPLNRKGIYIHNKGNYGEFYDSLEDTSISLVINHKTDINKVLRFIEFNSIVRDNNKNIDREQTITGFRIHNEYQDTGIVPFSSGRIKRRFDKWRLKIPRDSNNQRARLRSTHFVLTLYFDNTYNKELILNRIVSHFDLQIY